MAGLTEDQPSDHLVPQGEATLCLKGDTAGPGDHHGQYDQSYLYSKYVSRKPLSRGGDLIARH